VESFGEDAGKLKAGGAEAHRRSGLGGSLLGSLMFGPVD
jgi:hypothetical protein